MGAPRAFKMNVTLLTFSVFYLDLIKSNDFMTLFIGQVKAHFVGSRRAQNSCIEEEEEVEACILLFILIYFLGTSTHDKLMRPVFITP